MNALRRIAALIPALVGAAVAFGFALTGAATAAFAVRLPDPNHGDPVTTTVNLPQSGGLEAWQVALIAVAGVLLVAVVTVIIVRVRSRGRLSVAVR